MLLNLDGKRVYVKRAEFFGKIFGLMLSKKRNLIFELDNRRIMVHSFFVFFPIRLYFLDERFKIVEKGILRPFRFYLPKTKAKYLAEIPF